jgi:hypothetical protein
MLMRSWCADAPITGLPTFPPYGRMIWWQLT